MLQFERQIFIAIVAPQKKGNILMLRKFLSSVAVTGFAVADLAFSATSASPAPPAAGGTKVVNITDPILNMKAYSLTIPSNWVFQGAVIQGTPCIPAPFAVWRMSSPDGLTGFKQEPRLDWAWSENPNAPKQITQGCLDYKKEMPAIDVLKYMVGVLQVEFVNQDPVPCSRPPRKMPPLKPRPLLRITLISPPQSFATTSTVFKSKTIFACTSDASLCAAK